MKKNESRNYQDLFQKAMEARERAYAPYSKFKVGAAVKTRSGEIFTGCNVENSSYGLTNCAERTAIFKAVSEGHSDILAILVVADSREVCSPCGACRQVIFEFGDQIEVILCNTKGEMNIKKIIELLPEAFRL